MKLSGFSSDMVNAALDAANNSTHEDGAAAGGVRFETTRSWHVRKGKAPGPRITGVLRMASGRHPGARMSGSGRRRTNSANWQVHFDFMAALFTMNPSGRIQSGYYEPVDYTNELDFYLKCGRIKNKDLRSQYDVMCGEPPRTFGGL
jgi:hypothetical protein